MPFDLQFSTEETIKIIASYLEFASRRNDKHSPKPIKLTRFHAKNIPSIGILGYLQRILKYSPCGTECFLALVIYLERISPAQEIVCNNLLASPDALEIDTHKESIQITSYNVHRLIIAAALVSIKFLSDVFYTNMHISSLFS